MRDPNEIMVQYLRYRTDLDELDYRTDLRGNTCRRYWLAMRMGIEELSRQWREAMA